MMQSCTIIFERGDVFATKLEIELTIDYQNYTNFVPVNPDNERLLITDYGYTDLRFDIDDYMLAPKVYNLAISDFNSFLKEKLFPNEHYNLKVVCKVYLDGILEFEGSTIPNGIIYNDGSEVCSFRFSSNTDILNTTLLYNSSGAEKNPLNLQNGVAYTEPLNDIVHKCYKLINPEIELIVNHNWIYYGDTHYIGAQNYQVNDGNWSELYASKDNFYYGESLGDSLRNLAMKKFAFTGCINNSKAFFQRLFYYDENNLQDVKVLNASIELGSVLEYVATKNNQGNVIYELPDSDSYTNLPDNSLEISVDWEPGDNYNGWIFRDGKYYYIEQIKDPMFSESFYTFSHLLPELHYNYRSKLLFNRIVKFEVFGLNIDYLKNFLYKNGKYQILGLRKNISEGYSEIEALYLGDLAM